MSGGRYPNLSSDKRLSVVILSAAAVIDPEKRRKANNAMSKLVRGVSTWILSEDGATPGITGPFKVGVGKIGITTIGAVTY